MRVWGRLIAALRGTDPARLMAQGQAELTRAQRLHGPTVMPVIRRAIAAFQAADSAGAGPAATVALAAALHLKAQRSQPEQVPALRARAVAMLKARLADPALARSATLHHAVLCALSDAWAPLPQDAPDAPQTLALLLRARDTRAAASAALDPAAQPELWSQTLTDQAALDEAIARHPRCTDPAGHQSRARTARLAAGTRPAPPVGGDPLMCS